MLILLPFLHIWISLFFADFRALLYYMWWHLTLTSFFSGKIGPLLWWWLWWGETLLQQQQQASIQRRVVREEHRENLQQNGLHSTTATRTTTGFDGFLRGHAEAIHNILVHQLDFDAGIPFLLSNTLSPNLQPFRAVGRLEFFAGQKYLLLLLVLTTAFDLHGLYYTASLLFLIMR